MRVFNLVDNDGSLRDVQPSLVLVVSRATNSSNLTTIEAPPRLEINVGRGVRDSITDRLDKIASSNTSPTFLCSKSEELQVVSMTPTEGILNPIKHSTIQFKENLGSETLQPTTGDCPHFFELRAEQGGSIVEGTNKMD